MQVELNYEYWHLCFLKNWSYWCLLEWALCQGIPVCHLTPLNLLLLISCWISFGGLPIPKADRLTDQAAQPLTHNGYINSHSHYQKMSFKTILKLELVWNVVVLVLWNRDIWYWYYRLCWFPCIIQCWLWPIKPFYGLAQNHWCQPESAQSKKARREKLLTALVEGS